MEVSSATTTSLVCLKPMQWQGQGDGNDTPSKPASLTADVVHQQAGWLRARLVLHHRQGRLVPQNALPGFAVATADDLPVALSCQPPCAARAGRVMGSRRKSWSRT